MDPQDRETIRENLRSLQKEFNYEKLTKLCLEQDGLYYDEMRYKIERTYTSNEQRLEALLIKLTKRGPTAFKTLLQICDNEFPDAARILRKEDVSIRNSRVNHHSVNRPHKSNTQNNQSSNISLAEYTADLPAPTFFSEVIQSTEFPESEMKCYKMRSRIRGVAFIVNIIHFERNDTRHGASGDRNNLVQLWRQMGFYVIYKEDITRNEFFTLLEQLVVSDLLRDAECLVLTLMTHGRVDKGWATVEFNDSKSEAVEKIFEMFSNSNCPNMLHKPKVFFLPFCRGAISETALNVNDTALTMSAARGPWETDGQAYAPHEDFIEPVSIPKPISHFSDIKICYATVIGFAAQRDPQLGAWYIESLCYVFANYAHSKHLEDLLKLIGERTRNKLSILGHMQTPANEDRGFNRTLYFNPGKYE